MRVRLQRSSLERVQKEIVQRNNQIQRTVSQHQRENQVKIQESRIRRKRQVHVERDTTVKIAMRVSLQRISLERVQR